MDDVVLLVNREVFTLTHDQWVKVNTPAPAISFSVYLFVNCIQM